MVEQYKWYETRGLYNMNESNDAHNSQLYATLLRYNAPTSLLTYYVRITNIEEKKNI